MSGHVDVGMHVPDVKTAHGVRENRVAQSSGRIRHFAGYEGPAIMLLLVLAAITYVSFARPHLFARTHSVELNVAINAGCFIISLGAAYFALGEFALYGILASLFVGLAFITLALADAGLGLLPPVAGWSREPVWLEYGWSASRIAGGILLVVAALVMDREVLAARRGRLMFNCCLAALGIGVVADAYFYTAMGGSGVAGLNHGLQLVAAGLFFVSAGLFWRSSQNSGRTWYFWLSFSLAVAGFSQLQYAGRDYAVAVVQPGDILRLVFFSGILLALAAQWTQDYRRLRWQARELEALHALMTAPVVQNVASVVEHVVSVVDSTLRASSRVLVAERDQRTMRDPLTEQMMHVDADGSVEETNRIVVGFDEGPQGQVVLGVPLYTASRRLGMLIVARKMGDEFSTHDIRLLRAFGTQASVLLERSLLYQEVAAGAILEERSRLAREIHDGLAQHLAFLKMRVAWLQRTPQNVDRKQLKDIETVLETALIEARHAITTLRAEVQTTSTVEAIEAYALEFSHVSGIRMQMTRGDDVPEVGPKGRVELLRVVQEGLNNIRKHAQASQVDVSMDRNGHGIEVVVKDNGSGFVVNQTLDGHFGLQIMQERAESVEGKFTVMSSPGNGTELHIWVPAQEGEREERLEWLRLTDS